MSLFKFDKVVLPPFNSTKSCFSCGSEALKRRYEPAGGAGFIYDPAHVEAICLNCGAATWEKLQSGV